MYTGPVGWGWGWGGGSKALPSLKTDGFFFVHPSYENILSWETGPLYN